MNCCKRKRRTKGLFTFPNEEHGCAPRGCGNETAGAMAFPITSNQSRLVASSQRLYVHTASSQTCSCSSAKHAARLFKETSRVWGVGRFGSSNLDWTVWWTQWHTGLK